MAKPDAISSVDIPLDWSDYAPEPFVETYGGLDSAAWEAKVIRSIDEPSQDGIAFPRFPPVAMQERIHGHSDATAVREAFAFHRLVSDFAARLQSEIGRDTTILDFGSGWGRIVRPFMARTELNNIIGFEPNPLFVQVARALNPYVSFVSGSFGPPTVFADGRFDVIVAWSVFTHLPVPLGRRWLDELARILRPGGLLFVTAWGERFIDQLVAQKKRLSAGLEVHWFQKQVIEAVGDLDDLRARHRAGEVVFVPSPQYPDYGDTFMSGRGARTMAGPRLALVAHDDHSLAQDLLVYRRS
ncbi:MAG: class I SAM-dependent methyltransferase [Bauldia sp.]|nr:class I SAM-dependent methyltransferase [Bauldia sp.]